jgi:CelD/BcsL family acetyltransferase involved in cellulose biosynthesis
MHTCVGSPNAMRVSAYTNIGGGSFVGAERRCLRRRFKTDRPGATGIVVVLHLGDARDVVDVGVRQQDGLHVTRGADNPMSWGASSPGSMMTASLYLARAKPFL